MRDGKRGKPELGRHDYDGQWIPIAGRGREADKTFSVGIFQWIKRTDRNQPKTLKRSPVICRVRGLTSEPEMVYELAGIICNALDQGEPYPEWCYAGKKSFTAERRKK